jgi:two-component system, chemotaxis family, CheB/CheR fusion protein
MTTTSLQILVVDDNADAARMLKVLLRCEGHEARIALDGPAAIEAATLFRPDVVLLDLTLPGMSGVEVAAELRCFPELSACRLVAVTGHGEECLPSPSPFDHHLLKPVDHAALLGYLAGIEAARMPTFPPAAVA